VRVVEDEREVRELACEFLTAAGYRVLTAQDGWEALETAKRLGKSIQAVLADMVMPKWVARSRAPVSTTCSRTSPSPV
jgi:two-component system, cell cycle sensor histidine kinase and response regulator CckA